MKQTALQKRNKWGRPVKAVKRNHVLSLKCTEGEQAIITANAQKAQLTVSEFLREMACNGQVVSTKKILPREVLQLTGMLNHMAANLNQIAKKRNSVIEELSPADRENLELLSREVKKTALLIINYLQ